MSANRSKFLSPAGSKLVRPKDAVFLSFRVLHVRPIFLLFPALPVLNLYGFTTSADNVGQQIAKRTSMKNRARVTIGLLALTACEEASMLPQLQARAALDLDCRPSGISARDLDDRTVIAGGCGKRAIYVLSCTGKYSNHCTWLLNSPIRAADVLAPQKSTQPVR